MGKWYCTYCHKHSRKAKPQTVSYSIMVIYKKKCILTRYTFGYKICAKYLRCWINYLDRLYDIRRKLQTLIDHSVPPEFIFEVRMIKRIFDSSMCINSDTFYFQTLKVELKKNVGESMHKQIDNTYKEYSVRICCLLNVIGKGSTWYMTIFIFL